jgi:hypothetical protein
VPDENDRFLSDLAQGRQDQVGIVSSATGLKWRGRRSASWKIQRHRRNPALGQSRRRDGEVRAAPRPAV